MISKEIGLPTASLDDVDICKEDEKEAVKLDTFHFEYRAIMPTRYVWRPMVLSLPPGW